MEKGNYDDGKFIAKVRRKNHVILSELETLRGEVKSLRQENFSLRNEKENNGRKLQDLLSLLETVPSQQSRTSESQMYLQEESATAA